jgi:pimeloyl-ACP methyl ester carboxylesterase
MARKLIIASIAAAAVIFFLMAGCSSIERKMLFFPSHRPADSGLAQWTKNGETIGYARKVDSPRTVWLMLHGNAGQASDRIYAIPCFSNEDSVFILEYPGYGNRDGVPSQESFNQAAKEAYLFLKDTYPKIPIGVVGESIGSGPASSLARLDRPPDKLVLIVPFDRLSLVAEDHYPAFLVRLLLKDDWDNVAALSTYKGPVEIYGAETDRVIPVAHAQALAAAVPSSKFVLIEGGHNDWSNQDRVRIRY